MMQGVLTNPRVRLLLKKGHSCYRPRRAFRCDRATSSWIEASNIRKLCNLTKEDDVRQYVVKRPLPEKDGKKTKFKAPKIQSVGLQRKRRRLAFKKRRVESRKEVKAEYLKVLALRRQQLRIRHWFRLSLMLDSRSSVDSGGGQGRLQGCQEGRKKGDEEGDRSRQDARRGQNCQEVRRCPRPMPTRGPSFDHSHREEEEPHSANIADNSVDKIEAAAFTSTESVETTSETFESWIRRRMSRTAACQ